MNTTSVLHKKCDTEIHFAPIQGYTDIAYYTAFSMFFPGIDFFYTPYYSVDDDLSKMITNLPDRIVGKIIPQVLPKNLTELKLLMQYVMNNNFSEINFNLGCPYPMVTKRGRGAALIREGEIVAEMIDFVNDHSSLKVSIKTRLGMEDETDIFHILEKISGKNIKSVIIHPRTARQLYKGSVSVPIFQKCRELFPSMDFIFNGDITFIEDFVEIQEILAGQHKWMIGRGLLSNPFFAGEIKGIVNVDEKVKNEILYNFIEVLIEEITLSSNDRGHALNRIKTQFHYLANVFPEKQKIVRKIKKIKSADELNYILSEEF